MRNVDRASVAEPAHPSRVTIPLPLITTGYFTNSTLGGWQVIGFLRISVVTKGKLNLLIAGIEDGSILHDPLLNCLGGA